jgi:hypothetical protein
MINFILRNFFDITAAKMHIGGGGKVWKIVAYKCNKTQKGGPLDFMTTPSTPRKII